jgi:hypothetical protein
MSATAASIREDHGGIMSARTHTRPRPARGGGVEIQLPWWAIAVPSLAFAALLLLILHPVDAHSASGDPEFSQVLQSLQHAVLHRTR